MKLIKLTLAEVSGQTRDQHWDSSVWINPCDVSAVRRYRGYGVIYVDAGELNRLVVSETPEEIVKLLEECE